MLGYQANDEPATRSLVRRLSPMLFRLLASNSESRQDAQDLLQETWLQIHRVRHTYRRGEPLLPWLYAIARHVRIDHYRRYARTSNRKEPWSDEADWAAAPTAQTDLDALDALLAPLTMGEREVLEMLKVMGMSLEEVARATSSTVGAVKQRAHRAYEKLRKHRSERTESGQQ